MQSHIKGWVWVGRWYVHLTFLMKSRIAGDHSVIWAIQVITFQNAQITYQCDVCSELVGAADSTDTPTAFELVGL